MAVLRVYCPFQWSNKIISTRFFRRFWTLGQLCNEIPYFINVCWAQYEEPLATIFSWNYTSGHPELISSKAQFSAHASFTAAACGINRHGGNNLMTIRWGEKAEMKYQWEKWPYGLQWIGQGQRRSDGQYWLQISIRLNSAIVFRVLRLRVID